MKWLFFAITSLFLIVLQTVIFPAFSWFSCRFDLTLIVIVFLSLNYSKYWALGAVAGIGGIMDSLSGGPFFLYMFSYIWIFLIVQLARQLVFQTSVLSVLIISFLSVVVQQGLFLFSVLVQQDHTGIWPVEMSRLFQQALWGAVVIPPGIWVVSRLFGGWQTMGRAAAKTWIKMRDQ
ncbi:MAG: rod shape-determining protein MreD [Desulfotignum sp.]